VTMLIGLLYRFYWWLWYCAVPVSSGSRY